MPFLIAGVVCLLAASGMGVFFLCKLKHLHKLDSSIVEENKKLNKEKEDIIKNIDKINIERELLQKDLENKKRLSENSEEILSNAFQRYVALLDTKYIETERDYDSWQELLKDAYNKLQDQLILEFSNRQTELEKKYEIRLKEIEVVKKELEKIQNQRNSLIEAQRREQQTKEEKTFYSLSIDKNELVDIEILEGIKPKLNKPRILSMLIWSTFFQKPMNDLCNRVIGPGTNCGIYKITNQKNNMCYIGQAVDIATRWKEHAKCGLNIDTPAGNKLYQAMIEDGIWNFTWELLEKCDRNLLNEKEREYIKIYQSNDYGYNLTKGNK